MHHPLRDRCRALIALILAPAFCAAPANSGEIFKCVAKDGTALYQNFPCEFDSIGWVPSNAQAGKTNPQAGKTTLIPPPGANQARAKAAPVNVASTIKSADTGEIRIGMTSDEVRALLGEPEEMVADEPAEGGPVSLWRYADGRSVQFDHQHHVMEVQR